MCECICICNEKWDMSVLGKAKFIEFLRAPVFTVCSSTGLFLDVLSGV